MSRRIVFPFTAIVGQERMKQALLLNVVCPSIGGVLIRGAKGSAKSTAARALADLLPEIERVADCPFVCDPYDERLMCASCRARLAAGETLPTRRHKMPFVNLPVGATEDRVVGTLDFERALKEGVKALEPGVLAEANRGILYIDEVNLLDDHVADALLDAAAMGVNMVEREGVSVSHPSRFVLVGAMNPEEGELRPQLLDRFGLCVQVEGLTDVADRVAIVERRERFDGDPEAFRKEFEPAQAELARRILAARDALPRVRIDRGWVELTARTCLEMQVQGHRGDLVVVRAAKALAALDGRDEVSEQDVTEAMELALPHRMRRMPFEPVQADAQAIRRALEQVQANQSPSDEDESPQTEQDPGGETPTAPKEETFDISDAAPGRPALEGRPGREPRAPAGRSVDAPSRGRRGRYVRPRLPRQQVTDPALDATLRQAALRGPGPEGGPQVQPADWREKQRQGKTARLVIFVVDASGSMGVHERMAAAKGAVFALLEDIYKTKDRVALVAFRGEDAAVVLPPSRSADLAAKRLADIPTGGKTPLPAAAVKALELAEVETRRNPDVVPWLVFLTDGRANVALSDDVAEDLAACAEEIRRKAIPTIVIDTEPGPARLGLAKKFADQLQARCHRLEEFTGEAVARVVESEIDPAS